MKTRPEMVWPPWNFKSCAGVGGIPGAMASGSGIDMRARKPFSAFVPCPTKARMGLTNCVDLLVIFLLQDDKWCDGELRRVNRFRRSRRLDSEYCCLSPAALICQPLGSRKRIALIRKNLRD